MQKIDDFKRKIMSELEKENTISFKNLYSRMSINSYQERSNFLEALYLLQIEEDVYNPKKYIYKSFPKATHRLAHVTKGDNGLMLMNGKVEITSEMIKCDTILDKDLVVVNLTDKENPIITKVVQRDITSFIDYLIRKLDKEELTYRDKRGINEIVKLSQGYPLAIELIARAISYKNEKITDFLEELKSKDYRIENVDLSADSDWNGRDVNEQLAEQLSKVYQLSELNGQEAEFIKIMSLLPPLSIISYKDITKYIAAECKDVLITLDLRGWIKQTQEGIIMHEIVCESIYKLGTSI